ncbi:gluconolactonase domain protein [Mycobacterium xenopi 3993]|nr:gluconolactonase domain protein [Mycobacterium xenopi 3993]
MLRYDGDTVTTIADLAATVPAALGDMVVDQVGRAFIASPALEGA